MKKIPYTLFLLLCFVAALATGCTKDSDNDKQDDIVAQARADHKLASEYDEQWKMRLAEIYYKKAYDALSDNPEKDWKCYGHSGYAYACMLYNRGEIEQTMTVLSDIISKAENNKKFPPVSGAGTIQMMARCQEQLGMYQEAKQNYIRAYGKMLEAVGGEGKGNINVVIACVNTCSSLISIGDFEEAEAWIRRGEEELRIYEQHADSMLLEEYKGIFALLHTAYFQATGHTKEAARVYAAIPRNCFSYPVVLEKAINYLMKAGRYAEAADMYNHFDNIFLSVDSSRFTFNIINSRLAPRYNANRLAGRNAEALNFADKVFAAIDSALNWQQKSDAAELAVIYQTHEKELELNKAQAETRIHRILLISAAFIILLVCFLHWRLYIHNKELVAKNRRLLEDIEQREREELRAIEQMKAQPEESLTANQKIFRRICELMDSPDHIYTDMDLDRSRLAQLIGTNEHYVTDAISSCSGGKSVNNFLNEYRLRYAAHLLATTNDSVALIAEISGFARSSFFRVFSDAYGMSPSEYRKVADK